MQCIVLIGTLAILYKLSSFRIDTELGHPYGQKVGPPGFSAARYVMSAYLISNLAPILLGHLARRRLLHQVHTVTMDQTKPNQPRWPLAVHRDLEVRTSQGIVS